MRGQSQCQGWHNSETERTWVLEDISEPTLKSTDNFLLHEVINVLILQVCWIPFWLLMRDQETEAVLANMGPLPEFRKVSLPPGTHPTVGWDAAGFQASRGPDSRNPHPVNTPHSGHRGHLVKPSGPTCQAGTSAGTESILPPFLDDSGLREVQGGANPPIQSALHIYLF